MIKIFIIRIVLTTHISTISPVFTSGFIRNFKSLIYPIPDKTTLHVFTSTDNVPVFLKISGTISHSMCILAHNKRTFHVFTSRIFFHVVNAWIHRTYYVRIILLVSLFKLYQTRFVTFFNPFVSFKKHITVATLVSKRPENH